MVKNFNYDVKGIISNFAVEGEYFDHCSYGEGHINDTFLVEMIELGNIKKYILQRINNSLFTNIEGLMNNIDLVTSYCKKNILKNGGDPNKETLTVIKTKEGKNYYFDGNSYFRLFIFIENSFSYQIVSTPLDFYNSAVAFGEFSALLDGFDASKLYDVIPLFHDTRNRYKNFLNSLEKDAFNRKEEVKKEINFVKNHAYLCPLIVDKIENGTIPLRVTHNDTKLNNVLFDKTTKQTLAVVDLDTVMKGSLVYDFGDSIRFGCNPCSEDEKDLTKVNFRFDLYKIYVEGYLKATKKIITEEEKKLLPLGAIIMTFECGMRFLTDYLDGDVYFKTSRDKQNLDRARTQFKLVKDMLEQLKEMEEVVWSFN